MRPEKPPKSKPPLPSRQRAGVGGGISVTGAAVGNGSGDAVVGVGRGDVDGVATGD